MQTVLATGCHLPSSRDTQRAPVWIFSNRRHMRATTTEELLTAWRWAEAQTTNGDLTMAARDEAAADTRRAHDRYRDRIESRDESARELGARRATDEAS